MDDQTRLEEADKLRYEGEYDAAIAIYEELLERDPASHEARYGRALCLCFGLGDFDKCVTELELVRADHPDFVKGRVDLFKTYLMLGMFDEAKAEAHAILKMDPHNEEVLKQTSYFDDFSISPLETSRALAVAALLRVENGDLLDNALDHAERRRHFSTAIKARALALAAGSLRMRARCDWVLTPFMAQPPERSAPVLRAVLRVGAYEILWSANARAIDDGGPIRGGGSASDDRAAESGSTVVAPAVVDNLVSVAKLLGSRALGGPANAILRKVAANAPTLAQAPAELDPDSNLLGYLTHWLSIPGPLAQRWLAYYGRPTTLALAQAALADPRLALRVNLTKTDRVTALTRLVAAANAAEASAEKTGKAPMRAEASSLSPAGILLMHGGSPQRLPGWDEGWFSVQDEAAQCIVPTAEPRVGQRVIDLCAAPGGKSTQAAELMGNVGEIVAADSDEARLAPLTKAIERLGLTIVKLRVGDSCELPGAIEPADIVMLDAPCTGTGTLGRRPDLRWKLSAKRLAGAVKMQRQLLDAASELVRPGGLLLYSTCSLEHEENQDQMAWFARRRPEFRPDSPATPPPGWQKDAAWAAILPVAGRHDGFFVARRRRTDSA